MNKLNLSDVAVARAAGEFRNGNLDDAQRQFLKILGNDEHNPDALYFMALIDQQSGRSEVAEHRASELLTIKPNDGKALNLLGSIQMSQGKLEQAFGNFSQGILHDGKNPALHVNAAICQIGLGNPDASIEHCKTALAIDPGYANALNIMGNAHLGNSNFELAADAFRAALERQPDFVDARFNLGKALLLANKPTEAIEHFDRTLELAPENVHALTCKADALYICHQDSEAAQLYQQALLLNPKHAPIHTGVGKLYRRRKQYNEALASFMEAIQLNPNDIEALMFTGETFRKMGNEEAAIAAFQDVLSIDPDNVQASFHLATVDKSSTPAKPDPGYVRQLFDEFSDSFDDSLDKLGYNAPEQLLALAQQHLPDDSSRKLDVVDIGCGTGLSGIQFRELAQTLKGIDISSRMLAQASKLGIYDELEENDLLTALVRHQNDSDLIVSADTFPYIGDLESVMLAVVSALRSEGLFLFSVETHTSDEDYVLGQTARYSHSRHYIESLAQRRGLDVLAINDTSCRQESGQAVPALTVALRKPD